MLDHFLEGLARKDQAEEDAVKLAQTMRRLPNDTLMKLANGKMKLAWMGDCHQGEDWLKKFEGTEMMGEAMELQEAELKNEMARIQQQAAQDKQDTWRIFNQTDDQIRVQKKMLELRLAHSKYQGGASGDEPEIPLDTTPEDAQGSGAPSPEPIGGPNTPTVDKVSSAREKTANLEGVVGATSHAAAEGMGGLRRFGQLLSGSKDRIQNLETAAANAVSDAKVKRLYDAAQSVMQNGGTSADAAVQDRAVRIARRMGTRSRELSNEARIEKDKVLGTRLATGGVVAGGAHALSSPTQPPAKPKTASDTLYEANLELMKRAGFADTVNNLGRTALTWAKAHPEKAMTLGGAAAGGVVGGATGGVKGAVGGAALGAGMGNVAHHVGGGMLAGKSVTDAAKGMGSAWKDRASGGLGTLRSKFPSASGPATNPVNPSVPTNGVSPGGVAL